MPEASATTDTPSHFTPGESSSDCPSVLCQGLWTPPPPAMDGFRPQFSSSVGWQIILFQYLIVVSAFSNHSYLPTNCHRLGFLGSWLWDKAYCAGCLLGRSHIHGRQRREAGLGKGRCQADKAVTKTSGDSLETMKQNDSLELPQTVSFVTLTSLGVSCLEWVADFEKWLFPA